MKMTPISQCPRCEGTGKYNLKPGCTVCGGSGNLDADGKGVWRCISLWQPWAQLIVIGAKTFETRSWPTNVRGPVLIHAAKKNFNVFGINRSVANGLYGLGRMTKYEAAPLGCILGPTYLDECYNITEWQSMPGHKETFMSRMLPGGFQDAENALFLPTDPELAFGDFTPGRFAWKLKDPIRFATPVPFKGKQGFFWVRHDVVAGQMAGAA